jgi:DNA-directed RNA polymerase beta subunit
MATTTTDEEPIVPQGVTLRAFDDTKAARKAIYDGTLEALSKRFPLENKNYRLELSNVRYTGPQDFTLAQQKAALLGDKPLHTPVSGHFRLYRKSDNALVDEKDEVVMNVPYYTDRGTVINNGSEYTIANQLRLRPGVYTRVRRSGDVETQFNVRPGTGRGFRLRMEPSTGVVMVNVGHANMPIYPLLRALGVSDQQMVKAWGADVAHANAAKADTVAGRAAVDKLYKAFAGYNATEQDLVSKERYLADTLPKFALDPGVTSRTLGIAADGITPDVLLRASSKMFAVNRGEEKADDRDNPGFANVFGIDDLYRERIEKDAGRLSRNIMMKVSRAGSLKPVGRAAFSGWPDELLHGSGLAMPGDNSNPMALEEQLLRVTRMGEGGIGSADVVTDEARQVNSGNLNFIDPIQGPENARIGVDARLGVHTRKGSDGRLYSLFVNRQGRKEYVACDKASDSVVGFPNPDPKAEYVPAMKAGAVRMVPRSEVDYFMPDMAGMFSADINLNPMPTAVQGGRQFYGAKFWGQYLPAAKGEAPLVDSLMPDGKATWSEYYGRKLGTLKAPAAGVVSKVTDKGVTVTDARGKKHFVETVVDFPFNGLTGLTYSPTVKVGDKVADGGMVAASNFVDPKTGGLAMGVSLKMAWAPYRAYSYEDAIVLSESAAKKLASSRLYGFEADPRDGSELGLAKYMSSFPKRFTKEQYATLDDNGVVKPGTVLNKGDPISVAVGPKLLTAEDANLGKLSKVLRGAFTDKAQTWEHDYPGTVVESGIFRGRAKVNVKAAPPIGIGDKLSGRFALKGVCGRIVEDDKMPRDAVTNEPYDILMNPLGIPSRVAPGQLIETALGKLAKATGQQIRIPQDPPPEGWARWASDRLKEAGVSPTADVFDPETGKTLHGIGDGYVYFHAMHHLADKKLSAKGGAGGYTADLQPAKGGPEGAKRASGLDVNALLAHGATENLKDVIAVRGTKNEDFWKAVRSGGPLPQPQVPFVYKKAMNLLRAGGINVVEGQRATDIMPMTDRDTDKLAGGRLITNSRMLDDEMHDIKGGLFDPYATGGSGNQDRWAAIALPEPIPNPVMEEPVRRVLGLTGKRLQAVISGEEQLDGLTGGKALQAALGKIDVDAEITRQRDIVRRARGSKRDDAVKVIGYLSGCKKQGLKPKDWMITKVPVIPPMFRPVAKLGDTALISDINELYRDVIESAGAFSELRKDVPDSGLTDERLNVYKAVTAAYGLGDPISPEGQAKKLKGAIRQVIGTSPKTGLWQAKVISKAVDGVGRAVISPEPNYDMDQCGIPEETAWKLYKDYVVRGLARRGYPQERAMQLVDERAKAAKDLLLEEMGHRPVILDRAPTWHKFNFMAFWPSLVEGNTMRMNPVVEKAFTADHDGDAQIGAIRAKFLEKDEIINWAKTISPAYCKNLLNMIYFSSKRKKGKTHDKE